MPKAKSGNPAKRAGVTPAWTPFVRYRDADTGEQVWSNSRFYVLVAVSTKRNIVRWSNGEGTHDAHLSFRRQDRGTDITWRDMQRLKSELAGSEAEAIEMFPAESRLIDGSNQRHLWVWRANNPEAPRLGWYSERSVANEEEVRQILATDDHARLMVKTHGQGRPAITGMQAPFEDGTDANLGHEGVIWDA